MALTRPAATRPAPWRLDRVALNVGDLAAMTAFYCDALGFAPAPARDADPDLPALLGARAVRTALLRRGRQWLQLCACEPPGAAAPADGAANDAWFQHCALVTEDIAAAYARLQGFAVAPISRGGPQALPGGIVAFKFRDPEGHPLELIQFPRPDPRTAGGIDHSAICVADPARSIAFYAARLGFSVQARQVNQGPAQDALDGLRGTAVEVIALSSEAGASEAGAPHVELLAYRTPRGRPAMAAQPRDLVASRLVFAGAGNGARAQLLHDPDGHAVLLEP